jgi:hypothetical protein
MGLISAISKISPSPGKLRILLVTVLILTVPFSAYYTFYVRNKSDYFTRRNFRTLALLSSQITTKVESLVVVFKNACDNFVTPKGEALSGTEGDEKTVTYVPEAGNKQNLEAMRKNLLNLKEDGLQIIPTDFESTNSAWGGTEL